MNSNTAVWLLQAIDPDTGEVVRDPNIGLLAIDLMGRSCDGDQDVIEVLLELADSLPEQGSWHRSAHALVSLARHASVPTELLLPQFASHNSWWVRRYAARAAGLSASMEYLERLASDDSDNVRHAAITAISELVQHDADAVLSSGLEELPGAWELS